MSQRLGRRLNVFFQRRTIIIVIELSLRRLASVSSVVRVFRVSRLTVLNDYLRQSLGSAGMRRTFEIPYYDYSIPMCNTQNGIYLVTRVATRSSSSWDVINYNTFFRFTIQPAAPHNWAQFLYSFITPDVCFWSLMNYFILK